MKKRAMKKWIPKNTPYCYSNKGRCKWYRYLGRRLWVDPDGKYEPEINPVVGCEYLGINSFDDEDAFHLLDQCKECGEKDGWDDLYMQRDAKRYGKYKKKFETRK